MNPTTTALRRAFLMALVLDKVADASLGVRAGKPVRAETMRRR
jgi:hypothetical protein